VSRTRYFALVHIELTLVSISTGFVLSTPLEQLPDGPAERTLFRSRVFLEH
jgi:hypothetical protein